MALTFHEYEYDVSMKYTIFNICLFFVDQISIVATYEGETLSLIRISRLDMGVYVCTASNGILPAASRRIAVNINCMSFAFHWILTTI